MLSFLRKLFGYKKSLIAATVLGGVVATTDSGEAIVEGVVNLINILDTDVSNNLKHQ